MYTRPREDQGEISSLVACDGPMACCECILFSARDDPKEYALKQIEGTGISMSACREIAVSYLEMVHTYVHIGACKSRINIAHVLVTVYI